MAKLKQLWKNDYFQTVITIALMLIIVFGFWFGSQKVLNTSYPALAVVSTSMLPTLNVGDVIIVQGVPASQINANYSTGDIVVFRDQHDPDFRIVHRAVKIELTANGYYITTHGDNNPSGWDERFHESQLIGKVIARVPSIGNFALYVNALGNFYYFIIIIIIIVNLLFSLIPTDKEEEIVEDVPREKRKLFGKLDMGLFFVIILSVLLIGLIFFTTFGSFTFWQIGADPPQNVTIRGTYSDLEYQNTYGEVFKYPYNNVTQAFLYQGFMTYQIDCLVSGRVRSGVATFSWLQLSILILILLDSWTIAKLFQLDKKLKQALKHNSN